MKPLALKEAIIYKLMELLSEERSETRNNVIRKQSMTAEERLNEQKLQVIIFFYFFFHSLFLVKNQI